MYIREIKITNFRVFGDAGVRFLLDKGINVIVGENNSGKSALVDAIRIALSCVLYKKEAYFSKNDFHIDATGEKSKSAQFDIFLKGVPKNLIEIWDPEKNDEGEFHILFTLESSSSGSEKIKYKVWGGKCEGNPISSDTLEAINLAYLGALRDAENELRPSRSSKLATLLESLATTADEKESLVNKLKDANKEIMRTRTMLNAKKAINENLFDLEQSLLYQTIDLGLVEPKFESIMSSLRSWIVPRWYFLKKSSEDYDKIISLFKNGFESFVSIQENGAFIDVDAFLSIKKDIEGDYKNKLESLKKHSFELYQNGLGYNNLLYISAVLGDMTLEKKGIYSNLFLVEEPEAHLHPQLQELVLNYFINKSKESENIQVIMTSHSPTLVSKIDIKNINLLYENNHEIYNYSLKEADLEDKDLDDLGKYLDVTKSQMFFAKGIIFVEGISEAILFPEFAKILDRPLDRYAVEIVNINGVGFKPFAKILRIPEKNVPFAKASIVTDNDMCTDRNDIKSYISKDLDFNDDLEDALTKLANGKPSDRYNSIENMCKTYKIGCYGAVKTFEYSLALVEENIPYMLRAIEKAYPNVGSSLREKVDKTENIRLKALMIWLCIRSRNTAKARVAQELCRLINQDKNLSEEKFEKPFVVPKYIKDAIYNVTRCEIIE